MPQYYAHQTPGIHPELTRRDVRAISPQVEASVRRLPIPRVGSYGVARETGEVELTANPAATYRSPRRVK